MDEHNDLRCSIDPADITRVSGVPGSETSESKGEKEESAQATNESQAGLPREIHACGSILY
jgi:hypothetical protein